LFIAFRNISVICLQLICKKNPYVNFMKLGCALCPWAH